MEVCLISPDAGILLRKVPACKVLAGTDRGREDFNIAYVQVAFSCQSLNGSTFLSCHNYFLFSVRKFQHGKGSIF